MSHYDSHPAGNFCWIELATSDAEAARRFYSEIFGWDYQTMPAGDMMYTLAKLEDRPAAGLYELNAEMKGQGVPPHWLPYVSVTSADETLAAATEGGGKSCWGPADVMEVGRMAVIADPQGAVFAVWQPKTSHGAGILGVHGTMTWCELLSPDPAANNAYYSKLFGWTTTSMPMPGGEYTVFANGPKPVGGSIKLGPEHGGAPPNWLTYFHVDDCDGTLAKAVTGGAKVLMPPSTFPGVGRLAVLSDPQGAVFAIIKLG